MFGQTTLKKFNKIYDKTYSDIMKFVIIKCHNINDANDIIQEVYLELWKILMRKELDESNINSFLIGVATNKIKKHYTLIQKIKTISIFGKNEKDIELIDNIDSSINLENLVIKKEEWNNIWEYIKSKKDQNIPKIFYLYYVLELSIKEISKELGVSESYVKNIIYRTLKELRSLLERGVINMTNKDNMKNIIIKDFDKIKNYEKIRKRIGDNEVEKYKKYIIPACTIILILMCGIIISKSSSKDLKESNNNLNQKEEQKETISDNIIFNDGSIGKTNDSIAARPVYTAVKSEFNFLDDLAVPEGFVISNEMEIYVSADENDYNMSKLWEHYLEYCIFNSDKTECLNSFGISFTKEEQILGMGLWVRDESKYKKSTINGHEVTLYGSDDVSGKEAFFEYDGYKFYIASTKLTKDEFINLIKSIIK